MKTIWLILIVLVIGFIFGLIMGKIIYPIANYFLKRKVMKQALKEPNEKEGRKFFYNQKPYDLKGEIEYEQSKRKKFSLFNRKQVKGGISEYGNTLQPRDSGKQIPTINEGVRKADDSTRESSPTTPTNPTQYNNSNPTETRGSNRTAFNRNLFEKGKKLD